MYKTSAYSAGVMSLAVLISRSYRLTAATNTNEYNPRSSNEFGRAESSRHSVAPRQEHRCECTSVRLLDMRCTPISATGPRAVSDLSHRLIKSRRDRNNRLLHVAPGARVVHHNVDPSRWGESMGYRDRLQADGPKKLLAFDGGGIRGVLSIEILVEIEEIIRRSLGEDAVLADYFDYIAGTSTGAIIAAGLAREWRRKSAGDLPRTGQEMFDRAFITNLYKYKFDGRLLQNSCKRSSARLPRSVTAICAPCS